MNKKENSTLTAELKAARLPLRIAKDITSLERRTDAAENEVELLKAAVDSMSTQINRLLSDRSFRETYE